MLYLFVITFLINKTIQLIESANSLQKTSENGFSVIPEKIEHFDYKYLIYRGRPNNEIMYYDNNITTQNRNSNTVPNIFHHHTTFSIDQHVKRKHKSKIVPTNNTDYELYDSKLEDNYDWEGSNNLRKISGAEVRGAERWTRRSNARKRKQRIARSRTSADEGRIAEKVDNGTTRRSVIQKINRRTTLKSKTQLTEEPSDKEEIFDENTFIDDRHRTFDFAGRNQNLDEYHELDKDNNNLQKKRKKSKSQDVKNESEIKGETPEINEDEYEDVIHYKQAVGRTNKQSPNQQPLDEQQLGENPHQELQELEMTNGTTGSAEVPTNETSETTESKIVTMPTTPKPKTHDSSYFECMEEIALTILILVVVIGIFFCLPFCCSK